MIATGATVSTLYDEQHATRSMVRKKQLGARLLWQERANDPGGIQTSENKPRKKKKRHTIAILVCTIQTSIPRTPYDRKSKKAQAGSRPQPKRNKAAPRPLKTRARHPFPRVFLSKSFDLLFLTCPPCLQARPPSRPSRGRGAEALRPLGRPPGPSARPPRPWDLRSCRRRVPGRPSCHRGPWAPHRGPSSCRPGHPRRPRSLGTWPVRGARPCWRRWTPEASALGTACCFWWGVWKLS